MKKLFPLLFLLVITHTATAGDVDLSTSSMSPVDDATIRIFDLEFAPTPDLSYNVNFIFNDVTLSLEPDLSTLTAIDKTKFSAADAVRGGLLYDKWWLINGETEPAGTYSLYPTDVGSETGSATWRCKECHGWDYKGKDGAYAEGSSHFTGIKGVFNAKDKPVGEIVNAIAKKNLPLSEEDIFDLAKFLKENLVDMNKYIIFTGAQSRAATGDTANGSALYSGLAGCSGCHGADGKALPNFLGPLANSNPWESLHKIAYGHPGSGMPSMINNGITLQEMVDILTYTQTLPE